MLTKRLEILFDPKEFEIIKKRAVAEGKSIANLIREAVREKVLDRDTKQKQKALKRLFSPAMETSFDEWEEEKKKLIKNRSKKFEAY